VSGIVTDENNRPMSGVLVNVHGNTYTTSENGAYTFQGIHVPAERVVVNFTIAGYFRQVRSEIPRNGKPIVIDAAMISKASSTAGTTSFFGNVGGSIVLPDGTNIDFPANDYITEDGLTYTGIVYVSAAYLNPTTSSFAKVVPGGDQYGKDTITDTDVLLYTFNGIIVELSDASGNYIEMIEGNSIFANVGITIPLAIEPLSPDIINIDVVDAKKGVASNGGTATKSGGKYVTQLDHFSGWVCNVPYQTFYKVTGYVRDNNGQGIAGVKVSVGQTYAVTDNNGFYLREVPADGKAFDISVKAEDYYNQASATFTVGPLVDDYTQDIPVASQIIVTGKLITCTGNFTPGFVVIDWVGVGGITQYSSTYTNNGYFSLPVDILALNTNVNLNYYGNYDNKTSILYLGSTNVDAGNLELCLPIPIGENSYKQKADTAGSIEQSRIITPTSAEGYFFSYTGSSSGISISVNGTGGSFNFNITGIGLGTYILGGLPDQNNSTGYIGGMYQFTQGTITITRYDEVGGLIEGAFSGSVSYMNFETFYITEGKFSVRRKPDQIN